MHHLTSFSSQSYTLYIASSAQYPYIVVVGEESAIDILAEVRRMTITLSNNDAQDQHHYLKPFTNQLDVGISRIAVQMPRNRAFPPGGEPFGDETFLAILREDTKGPLTCLNPTQAKFQYLPTVSGPRQSGTTTTTITTTSVADVDNTRSKAAVPAIQYKWTSRNNRKGRHALVVFCKASEKTEHLAVQSTATWRPVLDTLWRMLTFYPFWDISWGVAFVFTWGSALWVLNGLFVFLPFVYPASTFHDQVLIGGGVSAFIGATVFELGSVLLFLESVNEDRVGCFGWEVERVLCGGGGDLEQHGSAGSILTTTATPDLKTCRHHHQNKQSLLASSMPRDMACQGSKAGRQWSWFPS